MMYRPLCLYTAGRCVLDEGDHHAGVSWRTCSWDAISFTQRLSGTTTGLPGPEDSLGLRALGVKAESQGKWMSWSSEMAHWQC